MNDGTRKGEDRRTTPGSEIWKRVPKRSRRRARREVRGDGEETEDRASEPTGDTRAVDPPSEAADTLRLRILGGAFVEIDGEPVTGRAVRPHNLALLSYLAASPGQTASRDKLIACFWPTQNTSRARHRLSVAIHVLKQELGRHALIPNGDSLTLGPDRIWTDLGAFRDAVHEGRLEEAVTLHRGPFLDGFHVSGARAFEDWLEEERRCIERLYRSALKTLIRESEQARRLRDAIRWYEELVASEPLCAQITMGFMQTLARAGKVEGAIGRARAYATLVEAELGIAPDPDVIALARDLAMKRQSEHLHPTLAGAE